MSLESLAHVPTTEEYLAMGSEIEKHVHRILPFTLEKGIPAAGLDIATGGRSCVPWAWGLELPVDAYATYNSNHAPRGPIQIRGSVEQLPVETESLWFVIASHIAEDFSQDHWFDLFKEWSRPVRRGGYLIVLVPDHDRWWEYVAGGGVHNHAHIQPQPKVGDMSKVAANLGLTIIHDELTNAFEGDHNILGVFQKL